MNTKYQELIQQQVEAPPKNPYWRELISAMNTYLTKFRAAAQERKEHALDRVKRHEAELKRQKKARRKVRNYGTRTGIVLKQS